MNSNYLLLSKENSNQGKRLRKRLKKHHLEKLFKYSNYKGDFELESLQLLKEFLISVKKSQRSFNYKNPTYLGVLTDDNDLLVKDFLSVPQLPESWDILFLQYSLNKVDYTTYNVVWKKVQIDDTRHFLINPYSIDKILDSINKSKNWSSFIKNIETHKTFGIQNMFFSEPVEHSIVNENKSEDVLDYNRVVNKFSILKSNWSPQKLYTVYPCISLVCVLTDVKSFIHTLYTFLSLDYPTDKIELVIIDDIDSEKRLKNHLPNDERIRFINIKPKESNDPKTKKEDQNLSFSLGYKLNIALKYCKYDLIYHLFDTNIYFKQNFKNIVECYLLSEKECLTSIDCIYNDINSKTQTVYNVSDLGNMIYTKNFWKSFNFTTSNSDYNQLVYNYIKFRKALVGFIPTLAWSFNIRNKIDNINSQNITNVNVETLLTEKDKESFSMSIENKKV